MNIDDFKNYFNYNPDTGSFIRTQLVGNTIGYNIGDTAGGVDARGYTRIRFKGHRYLAHRLALSVTKGYMLGPGVEVDHINGQVSDNRLINLREVSSSENSRNRKLVANNTPGVTNTHFHKRHKVWQAQITIHRKCQYLGT